MERNGGSMSSINGKKRVKDMAMVKRSIGVCKRLFGSSSCLSTSTATSDHDIARRLQLPPFDYKPRPYKGPLADEVFAKRKKFLGPSLFHFYQKLVSLPN